MGREGTPSEKCLVAKIQAKFSLSMESEFYVITYGMPHGACT